MKLRIKLLLGESMSILERKMSKKFDYVIFDIDGTLADTLDLCVEAFQKTFAAELGKAYSYAEIFNLFGVSEGGIIAKFVGKEQYPQVLERYYCELEALHLQKDVVLPGIRPLLSDLKDRKVPMSLVTGKGQRSAELTLRIMGLDGYFEMLESGSDVSPNKVEGLSRIIEKKRLDPGRVVYIGDVEADILAARTVGMWAGGAAWAPTASMQKNGWGERVEIFTQVSDLHRWLLERI
jgi:phosphoglycolate phosphatase/pyrophosphatase PpaX